MTATTHTSTGPGTGSGAVDEAVATARGAAAVARRSTDAERAHWLRALADALDADRDALAALADDETHLGLPRLTGEVGRTSGQLRLFAAVIEDGAHLEIIVDSADPAATPPKPDLRRFLVPLGVVAVYAASNFPFAFSVLGGDTASALATGNAVVVKAHPGHERLSRRIAQLAASALEAAGAPALLQVVAGFDAGAELVQHPGIDAVGFTGSVAGGRHLHDLAAARPRPIPFHGELGSINPVVVTPAAVASGGAGIAAGLVASFTLGSGQFCTKPGLVLVPEGTFADEVAAATGHEAGAMLTESIAAGWERGVGEAAAVAGVSILRSGGLVDAASSGAASATPVVARVAALDYLRAAEELAEERFGPFVLLVEYRDEAERDAVLDTVAGSLTATVHAAPGEDTAALVDRLSLLAGRVLSGGWPTGVAVGWAQQHGGPYPASTSQFTSVGATAVRRFQRPVVFQDTPHDALPEPLRDENLAERPHRRDGRLLLPCRGSWRPLARRLTSAHGATVVDFVRVQ